MSVKATVWFAAACLIAIMRISIAWEVKPCANHPTKGELISLDFSYCTDKTGDCRKLEVGTILSYNLKLKTGTSYKYAYAVFNFANYTQDDNLCNYGDDQKSFPCPGKAGQIVSHNVTMGRAAINIRLNATGTVQILAKSESYDLVCVEFPAKRVN